jgi:hypothetical protein
MANTASNSPLLGKDHKSQPAYYSAASYDGRNLHYVERTGGVAHDRRPRFWRRFCHFLFIAAFAILTIRYFDIPILRCLKRISGSRSFVRI